jgi:AbrB family looped-hinge helix DNA binding protein
MLTVSVSPKFQVVIPREIREALGIKVGQRMQALRHQDRVELIPLRHLSQARGFLAGLDTTVEREGDRV